MPMVRFCSPARPALALDAGRDRAELVSDTLVYRYDPSAAADGLDGDEGTFSICSFWYVEALTRAGRLEDARLALEKMFTYANHLGLYAEQVAPTGEQLGNFPQAFTHFSLICAAFNLDRALGRRLTGAGVSPCEVVGKFSTLHGRKRAGARESQVGGGAPTSRTPCRRSASRLRTHRARRPRAGRRPAWRVRPRPRSRASRSPARPGPRRRVRWRRRATQPSSPEPEQEQRGGQGRAKAVRALGSAERA